MNRYPDEFPCPQIEGYVYEADAGVVRFDGENFPEQRRDFLTQPHQITAEFVLSTKLWGQWETWMSSLGREWFEMRLTTMYGKMTPHVVRCISEKFQVTLVARKMFKIRAEIELSPSMYLAQLEAP